MRPIGTLIAALTLLFISMPGTALAAPSAAYQLSESWNGSLWRYGLSIANTSSAGENLYAFDILFPDEIDFRGVSLPNGWDGMTWLGAWTTTSPDAFSTDPAFDILPSVTLDGFAFESDTRLTGLDIDYDAWFTDPTTSTVPEPATWLLLSTGLTGMVFLRRRRNR